MRSEQAASKNPSYTNTLIAGSTSGFIGSYTGFFFQATKKRLQSGQKLPSLLEMGPRKWVNETFRGSFNFAACLVPTAVIQQVADQYCKQSNISNAYWMQWIGTLFSGALGGIASTAVENILLQQQLKKITASEAIKELINESPRRIFRGVQLIMAREAVFGYCYLEGAKQAGNYAAAQFGENYRLPAQIAVGITGSLATHPFDTMATVMQQHNYTQTRQAAKHLLNEKNVVKSFYKGGIARIGLFTTTMVVIGNTQQAIMDRLEPSRKL